MRLAGIFAEQLGTPLHVSAVDAPINYGVIGSEMGQTAGVLDGLKAYGNALLSPFTGGFNQPLGESNLYGRNPNGSGRSIPEALEYIEKGVRNREDTVRMLLKK